jgi:hypothetical protein
MKERIITGIGIGVVCIPILILSKFIVYPIFLGFLSVIAVWELLRVFGFERRLEVFIPSYAVAGLLPVFAHEMFTKGNQGGYLLVVAATLFGFLLYLAAICASPSILGKRGILSGKKYTCFPGFEQFCENGIFSGEKVVLDDKILTARGAGAAAEFGFKMVELLKGKNIAEKLIAEMQYI